jgi:uncharacterized protein
MKESNKVPNRLVNEKSPYLLQHAFNPVDWHPWGKEAFDKAHNENKPVFLSIGYSTCHWCHVMERESFEDENIARLMNDTFINIKVDREERPDIDSIYMNVCQMLTGSGGWPLSIMLTPDAKPFYAATYIPKSSIWGRMGMDELILKVAKIWNENKMTLIQTSHDIIEKIILSKTEPKQDKPDESIFRRTFEKLASNFDDISGGFGRAPKFPMPHNISFLLRYYKYAGQPYSLEMAVKTLVAMRNGGIFDHIGYGFHRYSTDQNWLVPHFEKMLYDQALLILAYSEAYSATGITALRKTAEEIIEYVLRDLTSADDAFYSAEDADSEGIEGKFYLWKKNEFNILGNESEFACRAWSIEQDGNFRDEAGHCLPGSNIPHFSQTIDKIAHSFGMNTNEFHNRLENCRKILFEEREKRIPPFKDDKILTDWNGLMIAALSVASFTFGNKEFAVAAKKAYNFITENLTSEDGRLFHRYRDGETLEISILDDYAFLVWGLLELYEATFEVKYLTDAVRMNDLMIEDFYDKDNGGFFLNSANGEKLITKSKDFYDGAIPSGNSIATSNLLRIYNITAKLEYKNIIDKTLSIFNSTVKDYPQGYSSFLGSLFMVFGESREIVVCGNPDSKDTEKMLEIIRGIYLPGKTILLKTHDNEDQITSLAPYTADMIQIGGKATVYICSGFSCAQPVNDIEKLKEIIH